MLLLRRLVLSGAMALGLLVLAASATLAHDGHDHAGPLPDSGRGGTVGKLVLDHGDDFSGGRSIERWGLEVAGVRYPLIVSGEVRADAGSIVRVKGRHLIGNTIEVAAAGAGTAAIETVEAASPPPAVNKRVLVVLITFTDNSSQPYTVASAENVMNNVRAYYEEASYGSMTTTYDVTGWHQINDNDDNCDYSNWGSLARSKATSLGYNLSNYTNVVTAFASVGCGWSGLAQVNGPYSWLQGTGGMSTRVAAHELGHNYGAHHAQSMTCTDGSGGARVVYSSTCTVSEYGDPFDVMGASTRLPWAWHRKQESIMLSSEILTVTSGTHTLGAVSLVDSNPKAIRVLQPGTSLYWYVEYRIRYGAYDNYTAGSQPTTGVLIRQAPNSTRTQSQLLDANPATTTFNDAAFVPGTTFTDAIHNVSIRVDAVDATSATITVNPTGPSDTTPPTTPGNFTATEASSSSIQLTWTASTDNVGVTGYELRRNGSLIASPSAAATSYLDTGRSAGVTYTYTLVARDAAGNTSGTATTTGFITPPPPDTEPPTTPGNFTATEASSSSIQLTWTASTDNVGVASYQIWRNGTPIAFPNGSATSFLDTGRTPGVVYTYQIQAYDSAQNQSGIATTTGSITPPPPGDTTPPSVPGNFRVTGQQGANATFAWNASTDNVGVAGYRVYVNGSLAGTTTSLSFTAKIGKGTSTAYVVAFDAAGNSSGNSNTISVSR